MGYFCDFIKGSVITNGLRIILLCLWQEESWKLSRVNERENAYCAVDRKDEIH